MGKKKSKSQFRRKFLFILSLFFVLLIFLLGVEVGQRFSGMSLKGQKRGAGKRYLSNNEKNGADITEAVDNSSQEVEPDPKITFYDELQGDSKDGSTSVAKSKSPEESTRHKEEAKKETSVPSSEDTKLNHQSSKYSLQLGSYKVRSQAEELERELKSKGYNAYILEANIPEKGIWYRVKIGDYGDLEEVRQMAVDLQKKEGKSAIVTSVSR